MVFDLADVQHYARGVGLKHTPIKHMGDSPDQLRKEGKHQARLKHV